VPRVFDRHWDTLHRSQNFYYECEGEPGFAGESGAGGAVKAAARQLLVALGLLATACVVGGLEVNPALDGAAGSAGTAMGGTTAGRNATGGVPAGGAAGGELLGGGGAGEDGGTPNETPLGGSSSGSSALGGDGSLGGEAGGTGMPACEGYVESNDAGNAFAVPVQTGAAEPTSQKADTGVAVCGQLDVNHFTAATGVVDVDSFAFDVPQATEVFVSVELGSEVPADLIELVVTGTGVTNHRVRATPRNGSTWLKLGAGSATVSLVVHNGAALTKSVRYVLRVTKDDLAARCAQVAKADADVAYTESQDGPSNTANDVLIPSLALSEQQPTADTTDAAEDHNFLLRSGQRGLISGSLANVDHGAGSAYLDGDTFLVSAFGSYQFTLRLDWAGAAANLDVWVFEEGDFRAIAHTTATSKTGPELMTFAVENTKSYWVWVGAATGSTGLPQSYALTLCGEGFGI